MGLNGFINNPVSWINEFINMKTFAKCKMNYRYKGLNVRLFILIIS